MHAKDIAQLIRQAIDGLSKENPNHRPLLTLANLATEDLPSSEELRREIDNVFCSAPQSGIVTRLQELFGPCQNVQEVATVAAEAVGLAAHHRYSERAVGAHSSSNEIYTLQPLLESGRVANWQAHILAPLAGALGCLGIKTPGTALEVVGSTYDINTVQVILAFIVSELDQLSAGQPKSERTRYCEEAAQVIAEAIWFAYKDVVKELRQSRNKEAVKAIVEHRVSIPALEGFARVANLRRRQTGEVKGRRSELLSFTLPSP
jgi:hypothetical protein